ncbi:putative uridine kinase DAS2 [Sugiyamaella lignohabitans]|uniref:Putative uridine kinase DAS2 n=1 Tax=Sugiyamaella lignohabitans TaxID=796027 RepID=A0A167DU73_9ASCO|nr:putative uridine kinase DAS2 [Sugiyamaella lignohabitans]ANB13295.1 putative uridine kinase DAS2 [Sugiyamaella lignohabitans]
MPSQNHLLVLVGGGHGSGKHDISNLLQRQLNSLRSEPFNKAFPILVREIDLIEYDKYHNNLSEKDGDSEDNDSYSPLRFDFEKLVGDLDTDAFWNTLEQRGNLTESESGDVAIDKDQELNGPVNPAAVTPNTIPEKTPLVAILTGPYALYDSRIRDKAIMKVYVDVDADTRLSRLLLRDVKPDNSNLSLLIDTYLNHLRPEVTEFVEPTKQYADVILTKPSSAEGGEYGVELIATGVYDRIKAESYNSLDSNTGTLTLGKHVTQNSYRYRRESFVEQHESYYSLN